MSEPGRCPDCGECGTHKGTCQSSLMRGGYFFAVEAERDALAARVETLENALRDAKTHLDAAHERAERIEHEGTPAWSVDATTVRAHINVVRDDIDIVLEARPSGEPDTFAGLPQHHQPNGGSCTCSGYARPGEPVVFDRSRCPIHGGEARP